MPTPIIIGVGDFINRSLAPKDAREPRDLMLSAISAAIKDTGCPNFSALQSSIDSIDVVSTWTWPYPDLPGSIASHLGVSPNHAELSPHGGNQPAYIADAAARRISLGQSRVAVLTGGEALASLTACAKAGQMHPPGWSKPASSVDSVFSPTTRELLADEGGKHGIGAPIQVYPLYENGFRAARRQTVEENHKESVELYGRFAEVAVQNEMAWDYGGGKTRKEIGTVGGKNRMVCFPCECHALREGCHGPLTVQIPC